MAKKRRAAAVPSETATAVARDNAITGVESRIEDFAEDLGNLLGTARAKAEDWLGQRKLIASNLAQIRDTAQRLLSELSGASDSRRRGRTDGAAKPAAPAKRGKRRRKWTMSAEARERIAAAQRARWAKQKAGK